ncbi:hypothetical protein GGF31_003501 [Allomyces arbusculus]|nr:hypothetical protein GGF31_003501 [Allomyces arbusculus]
MRSLLNSSASLSAIRAARLALRSPAPIRPAPSHFTSPRSFAPASSRFLSTTPSLLSSDDSKMNPITPPEPLQRTSSVGSDSSDVQVSGTGYRVPKAPAPHEQTPTTDVARIIQETSNDPPKPFEPKPASFPVQPDTSIVEGNGNGHGNGNGSGASAGHATCSCGGDHAPGAHASNTLTVGAAPKKPKHLFKSTSALIADKPAKDATLAGAVAAKDANDPTKTPTTPQSNPAALMTSIPTTFSTLGKLLESNKKWAANVNKRKPNYFTNLAAQQSPQLLWIGCSDSRVPANQLLNLEPGEVFVARNIANVVTHTDMSLLSVLQYAVDVLKVKHVIVCGHYGCGGVIASMTSKQFGLIDNWLRTIKDIYTANQSKLDALPDNKARVDLMCELNVVQSVHNVCATTIVQNAWARKQELSVHGWCYRIDDGLVRDLGICISEPNQISQIYKVVGEKANPNA